MQTAPPLSEVTSAGSDGADVAQPVVAPPEGLPCTLQVLNARGVAIPAPETCAPAANVP